MEHLITLIYNSLAILHIDALGTLGKWNYLLLLFLAFIEGPIATVLASALAASSILNPFLVFVSTYIGNLIADNLWYLLGLKGNFKWFIQHIPWLRKEEEFIEKLEIEIRENAFKYLTLSKFTLSFSIPGLIASGIVRVPYMKVLKILIIINFIWTLGLVVLGYYFGQYLNKLTLGIKVVTLIVTLIFFGLILHYIHKYYSKVLKEI